MFRSQIFEKAQLFRKAEAELEDALATTDSSVHRLQFFSDSLEKKVAEARNDTGVKTQRLKRILENNSKLKNLLDKKLTVLQGQVSQLKEQRKANQLLQKYAALLLYEFDEKIKRLQTALQ